MMSMISRLLAVAAAFVVAGCTVSGLPASAGLPTTVEPGSSSRSVTSTASPTGSPGSSPDGSLPAGAREAWQLVPDQASAQGVQYRDVIWTGRRFVSTAIVAGGTGVFVDSVDGLTWHRQPPLSAPGYPSALATNTSGVVAVGAIDDRPASWSSPDGLSWVSRADAFPFTPSGTDSFAVTAVVSTDTGWLAVGREDPLCQTNCGLAPVRALVWTSPDGLLWTRVPDQPSLAGGAMSAVTRVATGLVAVGRSGIDAAAWTSADGRTWVRVPDAPVFDLRPGADPSLWTEMTGVAAGHGVVAAVGDEGPGGAHGPAGRAWWSRDGTSWAAAAGEYFEAGGEIDVRLGQITVTPEGFLAVGISSGGCLGGIWAAFDGTSWECVAADPALASFTPYAAAASSFVEIVVGLANVPDPPLDGLPGAVWRRHVP
jgi:hypothetical protein